MDDADLQLRETFLEEASQLLLSTEECFLAIEQNPDRLGLVDSIFRLAHNIKGSANAVGFHDLGHFMHELESLFLKVRTREIKIDPNVVDVFLKCNDLLTIWIESLKSDHEAKVDSSLLLERIQSINGKTLLEAHDPVKKVEGFVSFDDEPPPSPSTDHKDQGSEPSTSHPHKDEFVRINLNEVDSLINDIGELVILQTVLKQQKHLVSSSLIQKTIDQLGKITRQIQDSSMRLRMVPMQQTFQKMQRIIRDTSKALGKEINLHISGETTGLDKTVLDSLGDPLVHLVRNAVDHGIEDSDERRRIAKNPQGNIWLSAYHQAGRLVIEIRDDGRGLDPKQLMEVARKRGILNESASLSDEAARQLIFSPGFSTKGQVTDISGRGVGLDVVKTNITKLKGDIEISSTPGHGTCFRILLPLTLAIIDGMIIAINDSERYVVPISQVHEIFELSEKDHHEMGRNEEVLDVRGKVLPLLHLGKVLGRPSSNRHHRGVVIISRINQQEFAFAAERVLSQQQIVIKKIGRDLNKISGISGSAILGDGKAALILDLEELSKGRSA